MNVSPPDVDPSTANPAPVSDFVSNRSLFLILSAIALIYAFLAGLRTVSDFDLGWQLATGRWVVQQHRIPAVDVFSFTAAGQPWIYPVGAGVIFYLLFLLGGYGLLSWLGAAACVGTTALLLRKNTLAGAALAILAVPLVAMRITPRADMFTVVLFAAFLSLLWQNHQTGDARLWALPLLMVAWVNLHLGFVSGLALVAAYVVVELLSYVSDAKTRSATMQRVRAASPWLGLTVAATLANPWGWNIYRAILLQQRVAAQHEYLIAEWIKVPLSFAAITNSLSLRQTQSTIYLLFAIAILAAAIALLEGTFGAAVLLLGATYVGMRYARMGALFACVVVVVGGPVLSGALRKASSRLRTARIRSFVTCAAVLVLAVIAVVRCYDLVSNRFYLSGTSESTFGAGLGWWFPEGAAAFIQNQNLPGEVFNTYDAGGYVAWRLGPQRRDSIDGRAIPFGVELIERNNKLLQLSPDSQAWQEEASRYNINTILLPLGRYDGVELVKLLDYCSSQLWQPVYFDETSAVFVRRTPETEALRQHFPVTCGSAPLPLQLSAGNRAGTFNAWANAATVLSAIGRNEEALSATDKALEVFPDSSFVHWLRANILFTTGKMADSEAEYLTAVALDPNDVTWLALGDSYEKRGRVSEAIEAYQRAAALSPKPHSILVKLAYFYLKQRQPDDALATFNKAVANAPRNLRSGDNGTFDFMVAQGRSVAWSQLGDMPQAMQFQEDAAQVEPDAPEPWRRLAKLYRRAGRDQDAARADQRAAEAEAKHGPSNPQ